MGRDWVFSLAPKPVTISASERPAAVGALTPVPIPMFTAAKDSMTSSAARAFVNQRIERYGKLDEFRIDSRMKTVTATVALHGESEPITVRVGKYAVEESGGKKYLRVSDCTCNRPWLQNLLIDFAEKRRVELPAWASAAL